jgi:hypothetical protein
MGKRMNWRHVRERAAMRRHGTEDVRGETPDLMAPLYPRARSRRRQLSKAELRAQAAEAVARFTGKIKRG